MSVSEREKRVPRFHQARNEATRIDRFEEPSPVALAALRSFCRRLGAPHLLDEVLLPTLQDGDAQIFTTVRDRPWPPWGLGARHITGLCQIQAVMDESYAISPVYVTDEDVTNVGLISALYKETLESVATSPNAEVNYLVAEGSTLAHEVLSSVGFKRYDDVFLTEEARYYTYRTGVRELLRALDLERAETADLLAHETPAPTLLRNALFHQTIMLANKGEWGVDRRLAEIIRLVRGGHAGKPGGVPGGSGRWGYVSDPPDWYYVSQERFLGSELVNKLLQHAASQEKAFVPSTVHRDGAEAASVDERLRRSRTMSNLGDLAGPFTERLKEVLAPVLSRMKHQGFPLGEIEIQVTASGDGDYFRLHRDAAANDTRELSFVYFFHQEPRRFSGGELRIFETENIGGKFVPTDRSHTLSPRQDMIVFFPSRNEHELLPVRVPSKQFADSRFTVNGWIHRKQ